MNWFWNWVRNKLSASDRSGNMIGCEAKAQLVPSDVESYDKTVRFSLSVAEGGVIYRQSYYDRRTDRSTDRIVLIHEDEDIGERVGQLVQMGMMQL